MHILYIHQHFSTPRGATGMRSYEFARALISRGHKVTMLCGSYLVSDTGLGNIKPRWNVRSGVVDGIKVIEYCAAYSNKLSFLRRTLAFLSFTLYAVYKALWYKYDIVFATSTPLTVGIPGVIQKLIRRKLFVFEVRDLWPELPAAMGVIKNRMVLLLMGMLEWASYHAADYLIGLSPGIVEGIVRRGINPANVVMIPNGCDIDIFNNVEPLWTFENIEIDPDCFYALYSGTHGIANGLDAVLDAAAELKKQSMEKIKIIFIGHGKLKAGLVERARREKLDNCIFFESIPKQQLARLQASCDAGLMVLANIPAFYYGTSPNKFFDYLASGLPVIVNHPGWVADIINKAECGIAVPPGDPHLFAEAFIRLLSHPEQAEKMGSNSRKLAETEFLRSKLASDFCDFLEKGHSMKYRMNVQ